MKRWTVVLFVWLAVVTLTVGQNTRAAGAATGTATEVSATVTGIVEVKMEEAVDNEDYLTRGGERVTIDGEPLRYDPSTGRYIMQKRFLIVREGTDDKGKALPGMEGRLIRLRAKEGDQIDALAGQSVEVKGILREGRYLQIASVSRKTDLPSRFTCDCGPDCAYALSVKGKGLPAGPGRFTVTVIASGDPACQAPAVVASHDWMKASLTAWKNNRGTVEIEVAENESSVRRTGTVGAGQKIAIAQEGAPCRIGDIAPAPAPFTADGGTGVVAITLWPADCGWTLAAREPWIRPSAVKGHGNDTIGYSVEANGGKRARKGKITLWAGSGKKAARHITIEQDGRGDRHN